MFQGSIVALITPFRQGQLDEAALARLVEWHIEQGNPWHSAGRHDRGEPDPDPR